MDQFTQRIIGFAVQAGSLDGPAVCRMFNEIIAGQDILPLHLSSDNDPLFEFRQWQANLRILEVTELKTVPYVPLSHPFVERLIGTIRRELLDQVLFWTATDLERKLLTFKRIITRIAFMPLSRASLPMQKPQIGKERSSNSTITNGNLTAEGCISYPLLPDPEFATHRSYDWPVMKLPAPGKVVVVVLGRPFMS